MNGLREMLRRFRSAGAPGAPTAGAVPADRRGEQAAELVPVFALLDEAQAQAREIRARGNASAAEIQAAATRESQAVIRNARERAALVREESRQQAFALAEAQSAAMIARAQAEAEAIRHRAMPRVTDFVQRIVAEAIARLRTEDEPDGPSSTHQALMGARRIL